MSDADERHVPGRYVHVLHPLTSLVQRGEAPAPPKVADQHRRDSAASRFNAWLAVKITNVVGTMWCAYLFAAIALIGLPTALKPGGEGIIAWIAQTFLQLVLLSIIIVGQNVQAAASDKRAERTYEDAEAVLHEAIEIQKHLLAQDAILSQLADRLAREQPGGASAPASA